MIIKVPLTGRVIGFDPNCAKIDGKGISGDPNDPIEPIFTFRNCGWKLVSTDIENDEAEIDIWPNNHIGVLRAGGNPNNGLDWSSRPATDDEKQGFLDAALAKVTGKTKAQLYAETGKPKLKKLKKHVDDYKKFKAEMTP